MISISQLAASVLVRALQESEVEAGEGLRLIKDGERFVLKTDRPKTSDRVVRYHQAVVLIVDRDLEAQLDDSRIDVEENGGERALVMRTTEHLPDAGGPTGAQAG